MTEWNINSAIIRGRGHDFLGTNCQDFLKVDKSFGVVCDGCGSGQYSEFGSMFAGNFVFNRLHSFSKIIFNANSEILEENVERGLVNSMQIMISSLDIEGQNDVCNFVAQYLLSTYLFFMIKHKSIFVGHSGDGIIIFNDEIVELDQQNASHYTAYDLVSDEFLDSAVKKENRIPLVVTEHNISDINRLVIATDGLSPLLEKPELQEIYGTTKRQLQRKFNVWQKKQKLFDDDVSCIVIEKVVKDEESSVPGTDNSSGSEQISG